MKNKSPERLKTLLADAPSGLPASVVFVLKPQIERKAIGRWTTGDQKKTYELHTLFHFDMVWQIVLTALVTYRISHGLWCDMIFIQQVVCFLYPSHGRFF
jgi:hypothetical protein